MDLGGAASQPAQVPWSASDMISRNRQPPTCEQRRMGLGAHMTLIGNIFKGIAGGVFGILAFAAFLAINGFVVLIVIRLATGWWPW